jgi:uncharacterized membrane protein YfcA
MGGSLLLIPTLSYFVGVKEGIIIASILLGLNNCLKIMIFFKYIQLNRVIYLMAFMLAGALLGSFLMTKIEEHLPAVILLINIVFAFFVEKNAIMPVRKKISWSSIQLAVGFLLGHFRHFGTIKGHRNKML